MGRKPQIVAYVTLEMTYPECDGTGEPLSKSILAYHDRIETACSRLSQLKHVNESVSSTSDWESEGKRWWREHFPFSITDPRAVEATANRLVSLVRKTGIKYNHRFSLEKQILRENDKREVYRRRIYPARDTRWVLDRPQTSLKPASTSPTTFPTHLEYLAAMAGRCFLIGGNDIWGLFEKEDELRTFLDGLSFQDRAELIEIYKTIVRKKHNQWFLKWMQENDEDTPAWVLELSWFLAVLDRLREGRLLSGTRGVAKKTVLIYWDDYLCGKPYTEEAV